MGVKVSFPHWKTKWHEKKNSLAHDTHDTKGKSNTILWGQILVRSICGIKRIRRTYTLGCSPSPIERCQGFWPLYPRCWAEASCSKLASKKVIQVPVNWYKFHLYNWPPRKVNGPPPGWISYRLFLVKKTCCLSWPKRKDNQQLARHQWMGRLTNTKTSGVSVFSWNQSNWPKEQNGYTPTF